MSATSKCSVCPRPATYVFKGQPFCGPHFADRYRQEAPSALNPSGQRGESVDTEHLSKVMFKHAVNQAREQSEQTHPRGTKNAQGGHTS